MTTPRLLKMNGESFWASVHSQKNAKNYLYGKDATLHYVVFDDSVKMEPFVRTQEIMFENKAILATEVNNYLATINAQVYDMTAAGYLDIGIGDDAVDPSTIIPEGVVVFGKKVIAGREAPLNFLLLIQYLNLQQLRLIDLVLVWHLRMLMQLLVVLVH